MEEWVPFVAWGIVVLGVTIIIKLMVTSFASAVNAGLFAGSSCLMFLSRYHVSKCEYDITIYDTIKTVIFLVSAIYWLIWTTFQIFRDNKHRRCFYYCRQRKDLSMPIQYEDIVQYDNPEADDLLSPEASLISNTRY